VQDVDVGVAQQAARGLVELSKQLTHLQLFLSKQGCSSKLADMAQRADAIVRSRLFSLVVDIADSSPQAAELVAKSGKSRDAHAMHGAHPSEATAIHLPAI
jgi:hypothetical protein